MKEYVEREKVLDILDDGCVIDEPYNAVKDLPAADVVEVRHGRWERNSPDDIVVYCSQCMMPQDAPSNYCPSCGDRMGKEDEHEAD